MFYLIYLIGCALMSCIVWYLIKPHRDIITLVDTCILIITVSLLSWLGVISAILSIIADELNNMW